MTYLVLARKWRPRSFDTLVGQDHVVRALTHALDTQRLHHAWLFTGTRGVGKTTLSRILAKSLNCEQGISARPCGQCRACTEIDAGRYVDYVELDAASNRGVEEMTQLLEQAVYAPSSARFKVYMIDEVHMLTGHAFNAMLKTLEEPPPHVKFILATTDPQKIPVTVLSRCLQFNLKHMTVEAIVDHLQYVLTQEGLKFEHPALRLLGQAAGGSMRDALSLTDQAIAYSAGDLTLEAVQGMLGTIDQRHLVRLLQALSAGQAAGVIEVADELAGRGLSYTGALADLAVMLSRIAIQQRVPGGLPADDPLLADLEALASALHPDLVQLYYSVAVHSRSELALAPDEYAGFVMACLRMLSLTPASLHQPDPPPVTPTRPTTVAPTVAPTQPSETGDQAGPSSESGSLPDEGPDVPAWEDLPEEAARTVSAPTLSSESPASAVALQDADTTSGETSSSLADEGTEVANIPYPDEDFPAFDGFEPAAYEDGGWEPVVEGVEFDSGEVAAASLGAAGLAELVKEKPATRPRLTRMTAEQWPELAASLPLSGLADELARQSEWVGVKDDTITLRVAIWSLAAKQGQARLRTVLTEHFGKVVNLKIEFGETGSGTARALEEKRRAERQREAEEAVANDPLVQAFIDEFGARVIPGTIAALDERAA
ncbi:MAG TPA: DNA polymerase III subunit gamma/tau [Burkholderiaceae bacterium]|nr:DNA polymerase III subunit gamma/tau [Burkholderiaceae bacterium]